MTSDEQKQAVARASLEFIEPGNVVGLGTGSTAAHMVKFLGEKVRSGLKVTGIPTSIQTKNLAASCGIPLVSFEEVQEIDVTIDGADEFDPQLNLIKGGGGALLREKVVASASKRVVIITDASKQVQTLGKFPLPIEVIPFARPVIEKRVSALGARVAVRKEASGNIFTTDQGNQILDCAFGQIPDPSALAGKLGQMPGIVEHGLFIGLASVVLLATERGVEKLYAR
jgi:ribose 5-phosphate isomerase A